MKIETVIRIVTRNPEGLFNEWRADGIPAIPEIEGWGEFAARFMVWMTAKEEAAKAEAKAAALAEIGATAMGIRRYEGGDSWTRWALFAREHADSIERQIDDGSDLAEALTGWGETWRGPGRTFTGAPEIKIATRTRVLVVQYGGLDV